MLTLGVHTLVEVVRGELVAGSEDTVVNGIAIDSRAVEPGSAFVAFVGEHSDGHEFAADAIANGARALIVTQVTQSVAEAVQAAGRSEVAVVRVDDPGRALRDLAAHHRDRLVCPVIGITGSTGKTTTKDLVFAILDPVMRVVANEGNMNNELGVPLTLMRAGADTDALVLEMAMRGKGQIAELAAMARPTHGLVTNVGETHMELLGSREAIAEAKGELVHAVPSEGMVFLNGDDAWSEKLAEAVVAPLTTYGLGEEVDVRATDVTVDEMGHPTFTLRIGGDDARITLPVPGRHNAYNAVAAAAVTMAIGVQIEDVVTGLANATLSPMRMEAFSSASGVAVINDAYNASPTSMRAAISALQDLAVSGRRVAVLGDMAELGSLSELAHFKLGEVVGTAGLDILVTIGEKAARIADGAKAGNMTDESIHRLLDVDEAAELVSSSVEAGDAVLVKASRVMGLERVVERLMGL